MNVTEQTWDVKTRGARVAAELVMAAHGVFSLIAVLGGFAVLIDRWWLVLHLPVLIWSVAVNYADKPCPLTPLEKRLRERAGQATYAGGFVEHYVGKRLGLAQTRVRAGMITATFLIVWNALVYTAVGYWLLG